MTVTLLERAGVAESADLRRRLRQALAMHAASVLADAEADAGSRSLAQQVTSDPSEWAKRFAVGVANNPNVGTGSDDPTVDSVDGDDALLWVLGQMWATYAPQWGGG